MDGKEGEVEGGRERQGGEGRAYRSRFVINTIHHFSEAHIKG